MENCGVIKQMLTDTKCLGYQEWRTANRDRGSNRTYQTVRWWKRTHRIWPNRISKALQWL